MDGDQQCPYASIKIFDHFLAVFHGAHGHKREPSASSGLPVIEHLNHDSSVKT